ncbi:Translation elongation factor 1 beta [Puccinia graminis f. sp. tritici]|uniref:Translation elongation factor 1 beta n=1 Tax=Puccinia graminis f. sp. tritici TaxID=56615 RepID=A0A5B0PZB5_PUCGR|nr:Translation elongation factor 1 beta [Puccinia graminis f. sp. tritici]KAA1109285.1 Translation elongation factor 1 beta [Puccinia graminis f. sp. tritici]
MGFDFTGNDYSQLEQHVYDKSYIEGYAPSQADVVVYQAIASSPDVKKYPQAARWWAHIKSWESEHASLPGEKKELSSYGPAKGSTSAPAAAAGGDDDDEIDLFGSDDEEVDEAAEKLKATRLAEYAAKKANKPKTIAKSLVTLDVKPWDDETDMAELEKAVRSVEMDGLVWGLSKLVPVGYGVRKMQISLVVEDEKVSLDDLQEKIAEFEDYIQSSDVQAMQKL